MPIWKNAKMDVVYYNASEADEFVCDVRIGTSDLVVEYVYQGKKYVYSGQQIGHGHYNLTCQKNGGSASLHRFPNGKKLEGYWQETGWHGFWRIHLA